MKVDVRLFATLKDRVGSNVVSVDIPDDATVSHLMEQIATAYPALARSLPSTLVAINQEYAFPPTLINEGDEIALFPPVSGGTHDQEYYSITDKQIDLNTLVAQVTRPTTGAVCTFTGTVRGRSGERETVRLDYEAYKPMAESKMAQVAREIREQWPKIEGISIVQRVGQLEVGEFTVLIAISAGHRYDGVFEAARYGIDRLKEIVPVWKREVGPHGEEWVEGHYRPVPTDVNQLPSSS